MPIFAKLAEDGKLEAVGTRYWIHAKNTASALLFLLSHATPGDAYNIIGFDELSNLDIAQKVAGFLGKPLKYELVDFHKTRPGHDRRYALDGSKLAGMGWKPDIGFDESLKQTVQFTAARPEWS
jgi:dTDP-glucose 4,6-dehydratase